MFVHLYVRSSLKLVDYLHVQADNPWYYYYLLEATLKLCNQPIIALYFESENVLKLYNLEAPSCLSSLINQQIRAPLQCLHGQKAD